MRQLLQYDWPGNVRQLQHVIERAIILTRTKEITHITLPSSAPPTPRPTGLLPGEGATIQEALAEYEREVLIAALKSCGGVQAKAARQLGISRSNLNYRIQKLGIERTKVEYE